MCKICENNYDDNLTELDLNKCKKINEIPILPNLQKLWCNNTEIKEIPILPNLQELYCENTEIKEIPILPNLQILYCNYTKIKKIPILPNLQFLDCINTNIKEIPILPILQKLWCDFGYYYNIEEIQILYKQQNLKRRLLHLWKIYKLKN